MAQFVIRRAETLVAAGVHPFFVLDGQALPAKGDESESRAMRRALAARELNDHLGDGGHPMDGLGRKLLKQMQGRTPPLTHLLCKELCKRGYPMMVAPYEAGHQCVLLESQGIADAVLTGDGDLLAIGAKTVIFDTAGHRLSRGRCFVVRQDDVYSGRVHTLHDSYDGECCPTDAAWAPAGYRDPSCSEQPAEPPLSSTQFTERLLVHWGSSSFGCDVISRPSLRSSVLCFPAGTRLGVRWKPFFTLWRSRQRRWTPRRTQPGLPK